jgi:hypothetical protein
MIAGWLISLGCSIIVPIDAFEDELWKGLVGILVPVYLLYYALAEFEHERKWWIVAGMLAGTVLGGGAGALI